MQLFMVVTNLNMTDLEEVRSIWVDQEKAEAEATRLTELEQDDQDDEFWISCVVPVETDIQDGIRSALLAAEKD